MQIKESQTQLAQPIATSSPRSGFWGNHLEPFLYKYCLVLCLGLVAIASARIISTYNALSLTSDEPTHFACGLEYVAEHVYRLEPQHPPLSRAMQALLPYLAGVRPVNMQYPNDDGLTAIARSGHVDRTIFLMRLGNLPFFLLACLVVGLWGNMFSRPVAVFAVALFTLLPPMLADAGVATTDMALGATVGAAFLAFIFWAEKPTLYRSLLLGFCTALACLSKFTALGYIPAAGVLALIFYVLARWPGWSGGYLPESGFLALGRNLIVRWPGWADLWSLGKRRLAPLAVAVSFMAVLIWACYWFSFGRGTVHGHLIRLPAPEFFDGVRAALHHSRDGHGAFLLGQFSWTGWWYYFPVVLLVKTPIAFLVLMALGTLACLRNRIRPSYLMPLAFSLGILLPAMHNHVNIGVRHIEPIYIGFAIIAALGLNQLFRWGRSGIATTLAGGLLVVWMAVSGGLVHPDYLSYVNAFAGKTPENILVDSNYDWGQNIKFLSKRLHQLGVQEFSMSAMDAMGPQYPEYHQSWYGLPAFKDVNPCTPAPGWNVISATIEKSLSNWPSTQYYAGPNMKPWYEQVAPTERLGPLLLYYVPAGSNLHCSPLTGTAAAQSIAPPDQAQPQVKPDLGKGGIRTTKLSANFYAIESQRGTVGVLTGSDGLFVVGDELAPLSPQLLAATNQFSNGPIQFYLNTNLRADGQTIFHVDGEDVQQISIPGGQMVYFPNSNVIVTDDFYGSMDYPTIDPDHGADLNQILGGLDSVLGMSGPSTKIVPSQGAPIGRADVLAHRQMIFDIRYRVAQLVEAGKTREQVLAARPTADFDASVPNSKDATKPFILQLYADVVAQGSAAW